MDDFRQATSRQVLEIIETRYIGPTDDGGSRFSARSILSGIRGGAHYDYGLSVPENHLAAAIDSLTSSRTDWELISYQTTADDDGYVFSFRSLGVA
nr:hypothetical protein 4 [bacterium]